jgi:hypothetical protein
VLTVINKSNTYVYTLDINIEQSFHYIFTLKCKNCWYTNRHHYKIKIAIDVHVILAVQDRFKIHIKFPGMHSKVANHGDSFVRHVFRLSFARISEVNGHHSGCTAATTLSTKTGNCIRMVTVGGNLSVENLTSASEINTVAQKRNVIRNWQQKQVLNSARYWRNHLGPGTLVRLEGSQKQKYHFFILSPLFCSLFRTSLLYASFIYIPYFTFLYLQVNLPPPRQRREGGGVGL